MIYGRGELGWVNIRLWEALKGEKWPFRRLMLFHSVRKRNPDIARMFGAFHQNFRSLAFKTNECRTGILQYIVSRKFVPEDFFPGFGPPMEGAVTRDGRTHS